MTDYYKVLELEAGASTEDIKRAYRRLAKLHHPDRNPGKGAERFIAINEAYEFLVDEKRRKYYEARKARTIDPEEQERRARAYREWVERQQSVARERAESNARTSFDDFMESPIYKTAMVMSKVYHYVFLSLGSLMIITPILLVVRDYERLVEENVSLGVVLLPGLIGAVFTYGVWYFLFKNKIEG